MKNILVVKFSFERLGGIDKQILRIANNLSSENYRFGLVTNNASSDLGNEFRKNNLAVYEIKELRGNIIKAGISLSMIARKDNWNILQAHLFRESMICRIAVLSSRKIIHIFRAQTYIDAAWIHAIKKSLYHMLDGLTSFLVKKYIANGPVVRKEIINRSRIKESKVIDIINGTESFNVDENISYLTGDILHIAMISNLL